MEGSVTNGVNEKDNTRETVGTTSEQMATAVPTLALPEFVNKEFPLVGKNNLKRNCFFGHSLERWLRTK